ncbi:hypothetical protein [Chitinophaga barathri]|uniref:Uncharacterized protein n=1 Tax=Chitinophaga barathri TaxID=1647451 RepID=A0A3N4MHB1_9BACT|nr:hypothetical protein [Chitinophaga barathri]RPD42815.1 hypothetical protein EG028_00515 [Chitinophaga barathri]
MKKLILVMLLLGATYATTQAQHRGRGHDRDRDRDRHERYDDCDDDRRGRGHYKKVVYVDRRHRDYRRDDCRERVVVVRPRYHYSPPPPPLPIPRRPRVSGVIVFGNR